MYHTFIRLLLRCVLFYVLDTRCQIRLQTSDFIPIAVGRCLPKQPTEEMVEYSLIKKMGVMMASNRKMMQSAETSDKTNKHRAPCAMASKSTWANTPTF